MTTDDLTPIEQLALRATAEILTQAAIEASSAQRTIDDVVGNMEQRDYQGKTVDVLREVFDVVERVGHDCRSVVESIRKALAR